MTIESYPIVVSDWNFQYWRGIRIWNFESLVGTLVSRELTKKTVSEKSIIFSQAMFLISSVVYISWLIKTNEV